MKAVMNYYDQIVIFQRYGGLEATKKIDHAFSVADQVIFLVNKVTHHTVALTWGSKKIERVANSSLGSENIAVTKVIGNLHFIKESSKQMYGVKVIPRTCSRQSTTSRLLRKRDSLVTSFRSNKPSPLTTLSQS